MSDDLETVGADGGARIPRPASEITALAAHVRRLSDRLDRVAAQQSDLGVTVSEQLAPACVQLRDQVAGLEDQLHEVLGVLEQERRTAPVHWPTLKVEQAQQEWALLAEWIEDVLVPWYGLTRGQLPDCWALHRPAVVELSWWRVTYAQAFMARSAGTLAAEWHDRWRRVALANIRAAIPERWCTPGHHQTSENEQRSPPPGSPTRQTGTGAWRRELAERRHWLAYFEEAVAEDLRWRRSNAQLTASPVPEPPHP